MKKVEYSDIFSKRHIGPSDAELSKMLDVIGIESVDELIDKTIPADIRLESALDLEDPQSEFEFLQYLKSIAAKNSVFRTFIGLGYYDTITPAVIQRNIFENPGWYTQYTPYQSEISQGRLEALLNFQTMVSDLTALPVSNASLLDESTAAAEAMAMLHGQRKGNKKNSDVFIVEKNCFPQTIEVLNTRALPFGIKIRIADMESIKLTDDVFGILVQYPDANGQINDYRKLFAEAEEKSIYKIAAADLLSLALLTPPGEFGADVVVGTTQRFGVPVGFGGPHAGYFATKEQFKRNIPGRIIGMSVDAHGNPALRMALQTREQHIKRERATSNICTAQVLLAIMAGMYGVYHGADGIKKIAGRIYSHAKMLDLALKKNGISQINDNYFDTLEIELESEDQAEKLKGISEANQINFRYYSGHKIGISLGENVSVELVNEIIQTLSEALGIDNPHLAEVTGDGYAKPDWPEYFIRNSVYMTHPVFSNYRTETEMMRYIKMLERKDLSLTQSMIPLGSCTMKLNAASELFGVSWPEFSQIHPFVPADQVNGYSELINELERQLCEITGFAAVSFQPNSGAQGEYAGLMVIKEYQKNIGESHRDIVLIPSSAHGTNPASAVMAGNKVVVVECDKYGNVKFEDLEEKAKEHRDNLSALMITYPSTHGVFEHKVKQICNVIHENGGQVYMDGANMNAQVGFTNPAVIGADVCHLNLHKTFSIPHGGGGPGMGPIAVAEHLSEFLPGHPLVDINRNKSMSAVSAAPFGSASILIISYAYIKMMGGTGLTKATEAAIVNANYIKSVLEKYYPVLYTGITGYVGHELIFDVRDFKSSADVDVEDVAKRLMDYGYHCADCILPGSRHNDGRTHGKRV
jgi:glycine dehydrogenase